MSGPLEGIIVLSADGRPVVHSHFANRIPSYPLLHSDYFATLLAGINSANAHISSSSSAASGTWAATAAAGPSSNRIYFTKDIKPVIWVPGVPDVNPLDLQNGDEDEEEDEEDVDAADVTANLAELSLASQLSARITASRAASSNAALEDINVWDEGGTPATAAAASSSTTSSPAGDASTTTVALPPPSTTAEQRGDQVVQHAAEALAEQGAALIHVGSGPLRYLCPVSREVDPLLPLTFLRSFIAILQEYLTQSTDPTLLTEDTLRDNFDIVYQLFEEIVDTDGNILTTEPNALKSLVLPPNWVGKLVKAVGVSGLASAAPPPLMSPIAWRRANSKYTNNELYVDLVESLEGVVARNGRAVALDVWAAVQCNARLSGTPDLSLTFNAPELVQDESFHPCVRYRVWRKERRLSFVPPDGNFELVSFRVGAPFLATAGAEKLGSKGPTNGWTKAMPVQLTHCIDLQKGSATALFQVAASPSSSTSTSSSLSSHPTSRSTKGPDPVGTLEDITLTFGLGPGVVSFEASVGGAPLSPTPTTLTPSTVPSAGDTYGSYIYDPTTKVLRWTIPKLLPSRTQRPCLLKLTWTTSDPRTPPTHSSAVTLAWTNPTQSLSHLKVDSVNLTNTHTHPYRPFKGVRSFSRGKLTYRV
ncbi:related to AP-3 adapter complex mu3A subunit [Sporisorium reilianum f. sp. reilianum]|uniref:Related to AP-3 adapter complex mu3A subunit n=1 Tax=Sporisorium reilianum f. sp. reilianum TaxID=72559 RepID=A0A2N8UJS4_9BASI|nr:related to AP-3 adapter complex mu3A subunit [Sporisorium reilianum f. sp. reilianum]